MVVLKSFAKYLVLLPEVDEVSVLHFEPWVEFVIASE